MKRILPMILSLMLVTACTGGETTTTSAGGGGTTTAGTTTASTEPAAEGKVVLATTTSTRDSGLLDFLLPKFKEDSGIDVEVVALGTGAAIEAAKAGNADVLMVHDRVREDAFIEEGFGIKRHDLMYNDYLLSSTEEGALALNGEKNIVKALQIIAEDELTFVSRGDESGTHSFEKRTWVAAGVTIPEGESNWYDSIGQGMSDTLNFTAEVKGFTISDRATFLATKAETGLVEVSEPSAELINPYGVIELNPEKVNVNNPEGGKAFIDWLLTAETAALIDEYGIEEFGEQLFFPGTFK